MRRATLLGMLIITVIAATQTDRSAADAHVVSSEYSLHMQGNYQSLVGGTVEVVFGIAHDFAPASCPGTYGILGCYDALQFRTGWNPAVLSTSSSAVAKDAAAPSVCTSESVMAGLATLGCLSLSGANLSYSGPVWHLLFTCDAPGSETLLFAMEVTFVAAGSELPSHFDDGLTITCWDLPPNDDLDGDGCTNAEEVAPDEVLGGQRNPTDRWDFYDVTENAVIDFQDTLRILQHYGHGPQGDAMDDVLDRTFLDPDKRWQTSPAENGIDLSEAILNLKSYGHHCN